ncbi:hypothetical protein RIEGSTA812A_PEG_660 [invertebrate metagenome]|uniref:Biopterin-dependent aromatic amino acid hydroxylase family profile domain-containing protein n=1 Tax=invertebrate metagenome TaxID=1711999 RepID=A0A484H5C7_9ZZZZ
MGLPGKAGVGANALLFFSQALYVPFVSQGILKEKYRRLRVYGNVV